MLDKQIVLQKLIQNSHVDYDTGCYLFNGSKSSTGYGQLMFNYKGYNVHRLSAYIFHNLDLDNRSSQSNHKKHCPSFKSTKNI